MSNDYKQPVSFTELAALSAEQVGRMKAKRIFEKEDEFNDIQAVTFLPPDMFSQAAKISDTHRMIAGLVEQNSELMNQVLSMRDELAIVLADNAQLKSDLKTVSDVLVSIIKEKPLNDPELLKALKDARDLAMKNTVNARIPECGDFGAIAQDLDFIYQNVVDRHY